VLRGVGGGGGVERELEVTESQGGCHWCLGKSV
jgi:hypothetical protein